MGFARLHMWPKLAECCNGARFMALAGPRLAKNCRTDIEMICVESSQRGLNGENAEPMEVQISTAYKYKLFSLTFCHHNSQEVSQVQTHQTTHLERTGMKWTFSHFAFRQPCTACWRCGAAAVIGKKCLRCTAQNWDSQRFTVRVFRYHTFALVADLGVSTFVSAGMGVIEEGFEALNRQKKSLD